MNVDLKRERERAEARRKKREQEEERRYKKAAPRVRQRPFRNFVVGKNSSKGDPDSHRPPPGVV